MRAEAEALPTILVVDDEAPIRNLISNLLSGEYEVLTAADGLEAKSVVESFGGRLAAVITDVQMPHMDGRALVEWLFAQGMNVPVILMSGNVGEVKIGHLLQRPRVKWLPKPFNIENLEAALKSILDH